MVQPQGALLNGIDTLFMPLGVLLNVDMLLFMLKKDNSTMSDYHVCIHPLVLSSTNPYPTLSVHLLP